MRAVVQRVTRARVTVAGETVGQIGPGLLALVGVAEGDGEEEADALAGKVARLRIFEDEAGKFDRSVSDVGGAVLAVSQFTLIADTREGEPAELLARGAAGAGEPLFDRFCAALRALGPSVETGRFGARMEVELVNDGPVTIVLG